MVSTKKKLKKAVMLQYGLFSELPRNTSTRRDRALDSQEPCI